MKTNNLITRFLDGRTYPEEERRLQEALEAQASLSEEERAVLDLLRLSFPEEDTAALLTEDLSADYDAMSLTRSHHSSFFTLHSSFLTRRIAAVLSIAAVLFMAFLLWSEKQETPITQQDTQPVIAEVNPQPVPQPIVEEKKEATVVAEVQPKKQPVKRRRIVQQPAEPAEEVTPAEPAEEFTIAMEPTFDSYADIEAEMLDIRRRGERIEAMVADIIRSY